MFVDLGKEPLPLGTGMTVIEQVVGAVFMRLAEAAAWPVVVRHDFA